MSDQSRVDAQPVPAAPPATDALAPAVEKFSGCRWHKPAEAATAAHCTHRDVLPVAGVAGFSAESWCADCGFYKLRRAPRKPAFASA